MRSQFYTTLLLAFAIQLDYFILHADAEDLKKPEISVQNRGGEVDLPCQIRQEHLPSGTNVTCNLYIGDSSEPFRSTWTKIQVCSFVVKRDDLKQGLQSVGATEVSCDYSVPTDPRFLSPRSDKIKIEGLSPGTSTFSEADKKTTSPPAVMTKKSKLPKAELELSPAVISIKDSMNLRCSRPDSAPASHCTFTTNQRREISGSDCKRSVTGAELLSGSHSARNEIIMRCFYSLEGGSALHSDPLKVTVLDLRKPNISVSTEHTETHVRCEAPPDITGAIFFLYYNRNNTHSKSTQAGIEERAVSFTVPRSSDSTLTYCCRYQFNTTNSELSDCAEAKNKDQSGRTKDQRSTTTDNPQTAVTGSPSAWLNTPAGIGVILTVIVILLGMTGAGLYWIHKKKEIQWAAHNSTNNDAVYTTVDVSKGAGSSDATSPSDVTYSTVAHLAPQTTAFQAQQDNVVYSSLKTD